MSVSGLEQPCGTCERPAGDHTLREWAACMGEVTTDLPYEPSEPDAAELVAAQVREQFHLDGDLIVADHVVARAITLQGAADVVGVTFPGVLHEFQIGLGGTAPAVVAKVLYLGDVDAMRAYGRLLRDTANGAANAAERAA